MIVRSVRRTVNQNVYDLHVPGPESYLANGIWHHNSGKTWAGARKTATLHVINATDAAGHPTYVPSLVVAQTYQLARTINIPAMREAFDAIGLAHRFIGDPTVYAFVLPDLSDMSDRPSLIYVRSADAADKIAGFEVGAVWGDECARWPASREDENPLVDGFIQSDGRLRHPRARFKQFNLTYTPEGEDTRVYRDFEERPKPDHVLYRSSTRANIHLPADYVAAQLEQLAPDLAGQYVDGFAAKLGANLIYGNFEFERNVQAVKLEPGLPLQLDIDFNKSPGMHGCVGQHFPAKDLCITARVIHRKNMLILQMVQEFEQLYGDALRRGVYPILELFGDSSGNTGSTKDGESYWDVIREELKARQIPFRMRVPTCNPGVADRANAVNSAFCSASGKVRYLIDPSCEPLIRDFRSMKWDGNKQDKRDKDRSHAADAVGYRINVVMPIRKIERQPGQVFTMPTR